MSNAINPAAPHFLPFYITAPGETDVLLTGVVVFLVVAVMSLGIMYFWLHSIPERLAHGASKTQFQLVAVMSLLALFTHNNAFWVGALLLALIPVPDFWTPLAMMADSLAKMAGRRLRHAPADNRSVTVPEDAAIALPPLPGATTAGGGLVGVRKREPAGCRVTLAPAPTGIWLGDWANAAPQAKSEMSPAAAKAVLFFIGYPPSVSRFGRQARRTSAGGAPIRLRSVSQQRSLRTDDPKGCRKSRYEAREPT